MAEERKENIKNAKNEKVAVPRAKRPYHRRSNKKTENVEEKKTRVKNKENVEEKKKEERKATTRRNYNKKQPKFEFKKSNLKIIPLGGLEEIGNNMTRKKSDCYAKNR